MTEELIAIARQMREDGPPSGPSDDQFAVCGSLLGKEDETRAGMADEALIPLAKELTRQVRESVTIGWTKKRAATAMIMRKVKVLL